MTPSHDADLNQTPLEDGHNAIDIQSSPPITSTEAHIPPSVVDRDGFSIPSADQSLKSETRDIFKEEDNDGYGS